MESVHCLKNNAVDNENQFAELPIGDLPHQDDCGMGGNQSSTITNDKAEKYADLLNSATRIVVDFDYGNLATPDQTSPPDLTQIGIGEGKFAGIDPSNTDSVVHMKLHPLLQLLIDVPSFSLSQQTVEIRNMCKAKACDLFVHSHAIEDRHQRVIMGVFGTISSVEYMPSQGTVWFNFGGPEKLTICIPPDLAPGLFRRLGVNRICALAQANVLIFGFLQISQSGEKFILMESQEEIAVDLACVQ